GPVPMSETPNKGFAVLTRIDGRLGFRQLIKLVATPEVERVRVMLDTGHRIVAASEHPFFRHGMAVVAARDLVAGDVLETAFTYREGYVPPDLPGFSPARGVRVTSVEPAGTGAVMTGVVRDTHTLFLTAGSLGGGWAAGAAGRRGHALPAVSASGRPPTSRLDGEGGTPSAPALLGTARSRVRRSGGAAAGGRSGPRRARRQPDGEDVHRRPERRV